AGIQDRRLADSRGAGCAGGRWRCVSDRTVPAGRAAADYRALGSTSRVRPASVTCADVPDPVVLVSEAAQRFRQIAALGAARARVGRSGELACAVADACPAVAARWPVFCARAGDLRRSIQRAGRSIDQRCHNGHVAAVRRDCGRFHFPGAPRRPLWRCTCAQNPENSMIDTLAGSLGLNSYDPGFWMPLLCFTVFLGVSIAGAVLDGFDLGVGMLMPFATSEQRARMFTFLGPWRDMNVFWIFLGCAILLSAFPKAWAYVSGALYLPLMLLAAGSLLRGVAYEFRLRALAGGRSVFAAAFAFGSLLTAFGQGLVLGRIAVNFDTEPGSQLFSVFIALCIVATFMLLGATW